MRIVVRGPGKMSLKVARDVLWAALEKARQLAMFGDPEAVMPSAGEKSTVRVHVRRTKKGVSTVTQHQRKRQPKKPVTAPPLVLETPDEIDDGSSRRVHHDVGEKVGGARKDKWKRIDQANLAALEALGEATASKKVTKKAVWGAFDADYCRGLGDSAGTAHLKSELYKTISAKAPTTVIGRRAYVEGLNWLQHSIDRCHTVQELDDFLEEWRLLAEGKEVDPVKRTPEEAIAALGLTPEDVKSYPYGSWSSIGDYRVPQRVLTAHGVTGLVYHGGRDERKISFIRKIEGDRADKTASYSQYITAMGERMHRLVNQTYSSSSRSRPPFWSKHHSHARMFDAKDDWSWADKKTSGGKRGGQWKRELAPNAKRVGGPELGGEFNGERLMEDFGFRGVEYGNWVADKEAGSHVRRAVEALSDLADVLGIDPKAVTHSGRLALAFGARGHGWANAHYEPDKMVINLTKTSGNGTLAHEWAHFMDHVLTGTAEPGKTQWVKKFRTMRAYFLSHEEKLGAVHPEVASAIQVVMGAIKGDDISDVAKDLKHRRKELGKMQGRAFNSTPNERSEFVRKRQAYSEAVKQYNALQRSRGGRNKPTKYIQDARALGGYWERPHELFARSFEAYIEDKLRSAGRRSPYLVDGTQRLYKLTRAKAGKKGRENIEPYPQGEDRENINAAFDHLVKAMSTHKSMQKALAELRMMGRPQRLVIRRMVKATGTTIKNRPGLIFDRMKHRWVRAQKEQPKQRQPAKAEEKPDQKKAAQGDQDRGPHAGKPITFQSDDGAETKGKIYSSGDRGATVVDEGGKIHHVEHGSYQHTPDEDKPQEQKPEAQPKDQAPEKPKAEPGAAEPAQEQDAQEAPQEGAPKTDENGIVEEAGIHDEPMPKLPDGFNDLPVDERAKITAHWDEVQKEMDARFPPRDYPTDDHGHALNAAKAHWADLGKEGWIGKSNVEYGDRLIDTLGKQLEAAGASPEDASELLQLHVRKLAHQEIESIRRTLGDHGARHLSRNNESLHGVLDALEKGGVEVGPKSRLAGTLIMLNHDMGYAIPAIARGGFAVKDNFHPQASRELWKQETAQNDVYSRVLGDKVEGIGDTIANHSGSNIDWEGDPLGTSVRLADNSHLFQDKMPEVLFNRPGAMEIMTKIALAQQAGEAHIGAAPKGPGKEGTDADVDAHKAKKDAWQDKVDAHAKPAIQALKTALIDHINSSDDLDPPQKTALLQAAKEVGKMSPKFLISRLSGRDMKMDFDRGSSMMTVNVEQSPLRNMIGRVFGDSQKDKQFGKMLEDFGHKDPEKVLNSGPPPSALMKSDGSSINFKWSAPKTSANPMEQKYAATGKRVMREWKAANALQGKQKESALKYFYSKLAKAKRTRIGIRMKSKKSTSKEEA